MCDRCLPQAVELSEALPRFWRDPTEVELAGGILRLADELDAAEVDIASGAAPLVRDLVREVVASVAAAVKGSDPAAVASVTVPASDDIGKAIRAGAEAAMKAGKQQVFDQLKASRKLASLPPRKNRKLSKTYLTAKAQVSAERIASDATNAARRLGISQVARDAYDAQAIEDAATAAAERALAASATEVAREGMAVGRLFAIQDAADEIESVIYTAILDNNLCEVCEAKDGEEYGPEEAGQAPNDDCLGELHGNSCRCAEVIVLKREG